MLVLPTSCSMQLALDACDDRVFQPRYHLFDRRQKLFEDEATLDDNTKIKNGAVTRN